LRSRNQSLAKFRSKNQRLAGRSASRRATEAAWLNGNNLEKEETTKKKKREKNERKGLTLTGFLMEGY